MTYKFSSKHTNRLKLLQLSQEFTDDLFALRNNDEVVKYVEKEKDISIEQTAKFIQKINLGISEQKWCYWGIIEKRTDRLVGTICLWMFNKEGTAAEVGFELHPDHQALGYMTEALESVLNFGFESLQLQQINGYTHLDNLPSIKLMTKFGFQRSGIENQHVIYSVTAPSTTS